MSDTTTTDQQEKRISVRIDPELSDDLAVLMSDGATLSDAVRTAVATLADGFRGAWAAGHYPYGVIPDVVGLNLAPYDKRTHGVGQTRATTTPTTEGRPT